MGGRDGKKESQLEDIGEGQDHREQRDVQRRISIRSWPF